ncbi:MAG: ABC transporter ATP-binding protein [Clostridia bacterium]|nr:ABC transporter ATP-binding protein [Clostridia bacterium]
MSDTLLRLSGVSKKYPGFELKDVSFELHRGYIMGLIGPNGAGKTTTIRIINNLARASAGEVTVFGLDSVGDETEIKRRMGYVPENHNFYDQMSVNWTAGFVRSYYPKWDQAYFAALLDKYSIDPRKKVGDLSKGTRAKLAVALAMAHRPELLILDEPTSGLDPVVRHELLGELRSFVGDGERSVLFSSHITPDLERIADYITILVDGRVAVSDDRESLLERYRSANPTASIDDILMSIVKGRA